MAIREPVEAGASVRRTGGDAVPGDLLLPAGTRLGAVHLGLLAAAGHGAVQARPRPRVTVISTGNELVEPGTRLVPGQIWESNATMLAAAAREAGCAAQRYPIVPDKTDAVLAAVQDALDDADLLVTSGGVSMGGEHDVVKAALATLGTVRFRKVAMQPGMPQGFGTVGPASTPIFTLPGNPVSAYVSFFLFVRPALDALQDYPGERGRHEPRGSDPGGPVSGGKALIPARRAGQRGRSDNAGVRPGVAPARLAGQGERAGHRSGTDHLAGRGDRRGSHRAAVTEPQLTHLDAAGQARMVDVSGKEVTARSATATGTVLLSPAAVAALREGNVPKGDALAVARIAGIQGAKRTPDLIPLCHPIGLHSVTVDLEVADHGVRITGTARTADRTGVEMEALTAVSVAALALIDMIKAVDPAAVITDVRVEEKTGGKTGQVAAAMIRALAVTVSNRAAAGVYADKSGPVLAELLGAAGCVVDGPVVVPDGAAVQAALQDAIAAGYDVVVTTGGTGLTPGDQTPEMTRLRAGPRDSRHTRGDPGRSA